MDRKKMVELVFGRVIAKDSGAPPNPCMAPSRLPGFSEKKNFEGKLASRIDRALPLQRIPS
jgi:hypothetical protein